MPPDQRPQGRERFPRHEARSRVRFGNRELSWRLRSRPHRSAKEAAARFTLRLAVPILLLVVALSLPEPVRLILLLAAAVLGGLMLKRPVVVWLTALKARRYRQETLAENRRENVQIIARYEQELNETQARYRGHRADPAEGSGEADSPDQPGGHTDR